MSDAEARLEKLMRKGFLPLAILSVLSRQTLHGYGLAQQVKPVLGGSIAEGTLYPLLASFEAEGWVVAQWDTSRPGPARKQYTLTPEGNRVQKRLHERFNAVGRGLTHDD